MRFKEYKNGGKAAKDKKTYAYNYLINKGVPSVQAAGIIGNLVAESELNTTDVGKADKKQSQGIGQWHSERLTGLKKFAGENWTNLDSQLDYILHELNTTEKKAKKSLFSAKTPQEATIAFMNDYERPAEWAKKQSSKKRVNEALQLSGLKPDPNYSYIRIESSPQQNEPYQFREIKSTDYYAPQVSQNISSLDNTQETTNLAEDKAAEIKNKLDQKKAEKEFIEQMIKATQVAYVNPADYQSKPTFEEPQEQMFQQGGISQFKKQPFTLNRQVNLVNKSTTETPKVRINAKELKNIILDDNELSDTFEIKKPRAEANKIEKSLPNKETVDFFNNVKKELGSEYFTAALKIQNERGNPTVNIGTSKGLPFSTRKNYNPFTNEINIPKGGDLGVAHELESYMAEVSHAGQPFINTAGRFITNDVPAYIMALTTSGDYDDNVIKYVYNNPNTLEYYTHKVLQPKLNAQLEGHSAQEYRNKPEFQKGGISQFLKQPFQIQNQYNTATRDNTSVNSQKARTFKQLNVRNKTDKEIAQEREARIQASIEAQKTPYTKENWRQQLAAETAATGDKLRVSNSPNFFDDYINPAAMIGSMASGLGQAPLQAQQSDSVLPYVTAIGTPLVTGALAGIGSKTTRQFANNIVNPLAGTGDLVNNLGNKYLPNAYKLNPKAFKTSADKFYRQVDNTTYNEGIESGLIKGKQDVDMTRSEGIINLNKAFGDDAYYNKGSLYYKNNKDLPYLFEAGLPEDRFIPKVNRRTRKFTTENTSVRVSKEPIPINDPNITSYKKDWLQGYKKMQQGGQIPVSSQGVYDFPNQEVLVPTEQGRITMKNVDYPILGMDEFGNQQLMQPNGEYQFPGKIIHEIPQTKARIKTKRFSK